jgi:hypothetical protein
MLFSSIPFLYYFLPLTLLCYFLVPRRAKNAVLLLFSLVFYAWGEPKYVLFMVVSILQGYFFGRLVEKYRISNPRRSKLFLTASVLFSLLLLGYCKYADMYKDRTDYAGGQDELSNITLQYDTSWQPEVDALETRVKGYKAEKDAAEEAERQRIAAENAAKREQSLKDQYSGKLPVEGMPVSCLKYTSLGEPDKRLNCKNFEKLEQNQKYFNVYWYDGNGEMIAAGMCAQWRDDSEFMLKTFSQYYPSGSNKGQTFHYGNGDNNSGSIRDDYDNPEDLWEDNQDWYEDEDEAWDEWENS